MNKNAIVTLVIGRRYAEMFKEWCLPGWQGYCSRHGLDLIIIEQAIDDSLRAKNRSIAWQKCLIHKLPEVAKYKQIAWVDSDVRIRPNSPNIFAEVPIEKIGAVDGYATPTKEDHDMALKRMYRLWDKEGVPYVNNLTPKEYHAQFGLDAPYDGVVQTGVIVFSPQQHGVIFQNTYDCYEDKGESFWNFEMRPLSYEILKSGAFHWLSPKFNMIWPLYERIFYPFNKIAPSRWQRVTARICGDPKVMMKGEYLECAFLNNYFLHFAGEDRSYMLIPPDMLLDFPETEEAG
jgi:hypothetical protein